MVDVVAILLGAILGASFTATRIVKKFSDYVVDSAKQASLVQRAQNQDGKNAKGTT